MDAGSLISELKRRRVFRVLVGYGVVSFAVLQVVEPVMHALHLPDVTLTYVVLALGVGFPVAVVLAWAFDVNEGRIERAPPATSTVLRGTRLRLVLVGIGMLAAAPGIIWYFFVRGVARPSAASQNIAPSIAVLPFADMSETKDQEYFADGLTEELLNVLTQVDGLHVAGRTSSFAFKGKNEDLGSIAQKLHVATLLEGSVRKAGNRLRITTQLISAADGYHLWSQTYDREVKDIFAVQEEIARAVVAALRVKLIAGKSPSTKGHSTDDMEAYRLYLSGKKHWLENNEMTVRTARVELEKVVALDPQYGLPWATLAIVYYDLSGYAKTAAEVADLSAQAMAAAEKAVEVAPDLAEAWSGRALRKLDRYDWKGAEDDISHALSLSPHDPATHRRRAILYAVLGRYQDAVAELRPVLEVDPLSAHNWRWLARFYMAEDRITEARDALERSLAEGPSSSESWYEMGWLSLIAHKPEDALAAAKRSEASRILAITALAEHDLGHVEAARSALAALTDHHGEIDACLIAEVYAWLGDRDAAFRWLERAYAQQDADLPWVRMRPALHRLRGDPRWHAFLRKMNLPLD